MTVLSIEAVNLEWSIVLLGLLMVLREDVKTNSPVEAAERRTVRRVCLFIGVPCVLRSLVILSDAGPGTKVGMPQSLLVRHPR